MIHLLAECKAMLYLRAQVANSLTSAVELAQRTRSTTHIAFAEKLLRIKMGAPSAHLASTTRYKGYLNYRASADLTIIRAEKYRGLAQQLDRIKAVKQFLDGPLPFENPPASAVK